MNPLISTYKAFYVAMWMSYSIQDILYVEIGTQISTHNARRIEKIYPYVENYDSHVEINGF
jgi:hypothetical protein